MEGAAKIIKCLVVFFNFIFFLFGCALIGVGAWALATSGDYATLTDSIPYATASKVTLAAGVFIALVSFMGCCGAWKENRCMLITFFIFLVIILALEITGAALAYKHRGELDEKIDEDVERELKEHYGEKGHEGTTKAWDQLQRKEKCCGWKNYTDWWTSKRFGSTNGVPDSCCKVETKDCGKKTVESKIYTDPCKGNLEKLIKDNLKYIGAVGITIVVIQVLGMIFALVLICKIGKEGTFA